jgi:hypothetical protein
MLIMAILTVPLVAIAGRLIVLPVEWQENLGQVRDAREALHWVASDARQAACFTAGGTEDDYGTFKWTDYTETPAREFSVRYYSDTTHSDGSRNLLRDEIVNASPPRTIRIGDVSEFSISPDDRLVRAWVKIPSWAEENSDAPLLGISALMRPGGPASADC